MSKSQAEPVTFEVWAKAMQGAFDGFLQETWESMNGAREGHWIEDTEEVMRRARDRFGQVAYEKLLQLRLEQSEAAFSPSVARGGLAGQGAVACDASDRRGACAGAASRAVAAKGELGDSRRPQSGPRG